MPAAGHHLFLAALLGGATGAALGLRCTPGLAHSGLARRAPQPLLTAESGFEAKLRSFVPRGELRGVRGTLSRLQNQLDAAVDEQDFASAAMLRDDIAELRCKDPAVLFASLRQQLDEAVAVEDYKQATVLRDQLRVVRRFLPQYQLAGLWKGNYPNHGDELVRIHYEGDTLFATKVTGDVHVPAGEVTFQADLGQAWTYEQAARGGGGGALDQSGVRVEVVSLSSDGSQEQREVEQFQGEGRIAAVNFKNAHFVPGQLFLMEEDVLGFLWLPLGTLVVFSRVEEKEASEIAEGATATLGQSLPASAWSTLEGDGR